MKRTLVLAILCLVALAAGSAVAAPEHAVNLQSTICNLKSADAITIPQMLSYQGRLTDTLGVPVADTTYSVDFRLYTVPSGGSALWSEAQSVRTESGLFSVLLGSVTPIGSVPDAGALYLGMAVGGGSELVPRLRIGSAAYAYLTERAANADRLQGKDTTGFAASGHNHDATYVNEGQASSVTSTMITNGTIAAADVGQMGAASGQVMKWTGSAWAARNDSVGGAGDNAWVRVGSDSVLYTVHQLGIARGGASNKLWGSQAFTHVNLGVACTTGYSGQSYEHSTVGGGYDNTAEQDYSTISGGRSNAASRSYSTVGGGWADSAKSDYGGVLSGYSNLSGDAADDTATVVAGGWNNSATGRFNFIGGGYQNTSSNNYSTIAGGRSNTANGPQSSVGGGWSNTASGYHSVVSGGFRDVASGTSAAVSGGEDNVASGYWSTVSGGRYDSGKAYYSTVGGGYSNVAGDTAAVVAGGKNNAATGMLSAVGGGYADTASGVYSNVGGGYRNRASGEGAASVAGGSFNIASGAGAAISGGNGNAASDTYAFVGGGHKDTASGTYSTVGGGDHNQASASYATVAGGRSNIANGNGATVPGGYYCTASGSRSFAAGSYARARGQGSFVWSDSCAAADSVQTTGSNRWLARARGGFYFFTNLGMTTGSYLAAGDNAWSAWSDSTIKENFRPVDKKSLLDALVRMRVRDYNLKSQDKSIRHIGPVAQDFHSAFGFGESNTAINMEDADGVLMAAVQALYEQNRNQQAEIEQLKAELKRR